MARQAQVLELRGDKARLHEKEQDVNAATHLTVECVTGPAEHIRTRRENSRGGDALSNGRPCTVVPQRKGYTITGKAARNWHYAAMPYQPTDRETAFAFPDMRDVIAAGRSVTCIKQHDKSLLRDRTE